MACYFYQIMQCQDDTPTCIHPRAEAIRRDEHPAQDALTTSISFSTGVATSFRLGSETPEAGSRAELFGVQEQSAELQHITMYYTIRPGQAIAARAA